MKKIILSVLATTAFYAVVVFSLVYFEQLFVLSEGQAREIVSTFINQQMMLQDMYSALMLCKNGA